MSGTCIGCISNCKFDEIGEAQCGFSRVKLKGKYNYLTDGGKQVLPEYVEDAEHFTNNYGFVGAKIKQQGMCTLIRVDEDNTVYKLVVESKFQNNVIANFVKLKGDDEKLKISDNRFEFDDITVSFGKMIATYRGKQYTLFIK